MKKGAKILKKLISTGDAFPHAVQALSDKKLRKVVKHIRNHPRPGEEHEIVRGMCLTVAAFRFADQGGGK